MSAALTLNVWSVLCVKVLRSCRGTAYNNATLCGAAARLQRAFSAGTACRIGRTISRVFQPSRGHFKQSYEAYSAVDCVSARRTRRIPALLSLACEHDKYAEDDGSKS